MMHRHPALWVAASDRHHPDCSQPNRAPTDLCTSVYAHLLPVPTSSPWTAHIPSAVGEVISPLEKKKRMAQASLNVPSNPQIEDRERPSVIHCSQSPVRASSSQNCNSSDGSPLPFSSSSSRSPSPYSVSSEDGRAGNEDKPGSASELHNSSSTVKISSSCSEESKFVSGTQTSKDPAVENKDISHINSQSLVTNSTKPQIKDSAWNHTHKGSSKYIPYPFHSPPSPWAPTSTSSFTKVIPKSVQLLRPAPIRPVYKMPQSRVVQQDDSMSHAKKLNATSPWLYPTEKREKNRTMLQKVPPSQHSLSHSTAALPVPCVLSSYDKAGRDSRHQPPLHPAFLPNRMRLPHSHLMYRHVPVSSAHPALIGPALYSLPYSIPLLNPQPGYPLHAMNAIYSHKL